MAISTTTFNERLLRIEQRAKRADNKHRRAKRSRKGLMFLVTVGLLFGGASFAQDSAPQVNVWAGTAMEYIRALLPR
ncbi:MULTISPECIES: hypothetical protein [Sulfitobacter]|uniref:hypothetical protein n=1 Tax=Sulfitobacter TaxID=60136 RepID=UPI0023075DF8|nr:MULTISPECIES: hypothetical protein [Sulfitobacter]MDF3382925.1 hypothetical protein [Sulfitobacter sp. Ks11]MDF3386344.1 hypothetical protein [Sulfitobacter sp. M85]MDF3389763.1 hypothetical protein [Sulfitobacter sp. Ks16]MDF3400400.1 hypothetical protein [Sulfitobacter sp. KE39]MDF3403821.1 hypothetical protein [Sulfitobacter sp. Ks35]